MRQPRIGFFCFCILTVTIGLAGCSGSGHDGIIRTGPVHDRSVTGRPDTEEEFGRTLDRILGLPDETRAALREQAEEGLDYWHRFEHEAWRQEDAQLRYRFHLEEEPDLTFRGNGLTRSIHDLKAATEIDPTYAEAWLGLGRLCAVAGDLHKGREYLDRALQAAEACQRADRPVAEEQWLAIHRERCWVLRDLGLWNEALLAVEKGLAFRKGDQDLILIKGLVLAGAGRYDEAVSLAVRMEPYTYPQFDVFHQSSKPQTSDFANRWIKSQALIGVGDYDLARHVLGEMTSLPYRRHLPHQRRFWNDVGLAAELAGDDEAGVYYALSIIGGRYLGYYPWQGANLRPLVLGYPRANVPFYTSFGGRFLVAGSLLGYAAGQMNLMSAATFGEQRSKAAWRAREALDLAERRHIRPHVARAMRGRIQFSVDNRAEARRDLVTARNGFREQGLVDAGTSLLLGLLEMTEDRHAHAMPYLEEAVAADSASAVAWRSLGVCRARLGQRRQAAVAMDRALELEPNSVSGLYNRGLYHLQGKDFEKALADLDLAFRLDPENHEVQRLLQMAAAGMRESGKMPQDVTALRSGSAPVGGTGPQPSQEEILARLEEDIAAFFAVPDSLQGVIGPGDQTVRGLERQWQASADPMVRKILALAYMDRGMLGQVQELLGPGWGVDLTPEEELMLLYADRSLGEEKRARELANLILTGKASPENPYLWLMLPREERKHWTQTMLARNHFFEGYEASVFGLADLQRFSLWMRHGYRNIRAIQVTPDGSIMGTLEPNEFRQFFGEDGVRSATSGSRAVSGRMKGGTRK